MRFDSLALCAALQVYLKEKGIAPVFIGAAPAATRGSYFVISDVSADFTQEDLIATDGVYAEVEISAYGNTLADIDTAAVALWTALNRPGEVFKMADLNIDYCRIQRDGITSDTTPAGAEESQIFYQLTALIKATNSEVLNEI